jgi:hypothetical protein
MENTSSAPIQKIFTYQAPKDDQPQRYEKLRAKAKELALLIMESCPMSHERGVAIDKLRESIMWANSSIAVNE